ncbi:glycosyl transferase group 1 [Beutenbergia cavernae DSM 12333]|uniref:D-inositol 3-phosphate glycosyltransferase n=1 Tax=Beutenbergia cavernae (strain ATCC BAA-8 / DSM 12333 / CCUG 43141 / JCM 11478 / NBRC 16432 / NCIMB 13614 / HKI 0122) TaxID=471853 RepID=C5BZV1_BEUC1|nr:glycosyltransferase [Beutenbergia cavernae]ACQ81281.1 glycosyl transferase group 1 [Beutenbergia cavernae DSM 12333]
MRIVHVSDCFAPRVGGIETQVGDLAAHQARAGHDVHVLTATAALPHRGRNRYRSTATSADGVRVHRVASRVTFGVPIHPRGHALVSRALSALAPDVVHVHAGVLSPFAFDGARAARDLDLPLAITWHCMLDGVEGVLRRGASLIGWDGESAALSAVSAVAAERVARALPLPDGEPADVGVLPNGLDVAVWAPTGPRADRAADAPLRVVATQRLAPRKRARVLVRVVADVAERIGPGRVRLTVAGDGPDAGAVRAEAARLGVADDVELLGRVPRADLPALYREQDAFLSPAQLEAFGIAALEARAAGLAVVARTGTGISGFVADGRDGLLADDDDALADAVVRLATEPDLRAAIHAHNAATPPEADWLDVLAAAEREYARARRLVRY